MSDNVPTAAENQASFNERASSSINTCSVSMSGCYEQLEADVFKYSSPCVAEECLTKVQQSESCSRQVLQNPDPEVCRPPMPTFKARKSKPSSFEGSCSSTASSSGFESLQSTTGYVDEVFIGADGSSVALADKVVKNATTHKNSQGSGTFSVDSNSVVENNVDCINTVDHNLIPPISSVHNVDCTGSEKCLSVSSDRQSEILSNNDEIAAQICFTISKLSECELSGTSRSVETKASSNSSVTEENVVNFETTRTSSKTSECEQFGRDVTHPINTCKSSDPTTREVSPVTIVDSGVRKGDQPNLFNFQSGDRTLEAAMSVLKSDLVNEYNELKTAPCSDQETVDVDAPDSMNASVDLCRSTSTRRHAPVATLSEFDDDYDALGLDPDLFAPKWTSEQSLPSDNIIFKIPSGPSRVTPKLSTGMFGQAVDEDETDGNISEDGMSDGGEFLDDNFEFRRPSPEILLKSIPIVASQQHLVTSKKGYLFKYSSQKSALGKLGSVWQKRWVTVDQESLKYYLSKKSVVSKRVIPISTLIDIQQEIKIGDTHAFRFQLKTVDRMYKFAAESSDELALWTSILMHSMMDLKGEFSPLCGNLDPPDKADFVRLEGKSKKQYLVLKSGRLCFYNTVSDFRALSPIHCEELQLASIKDLGKLKLQLLFPQASFTFIFETQDEFNSWKAALKEGILLAHGDDKVLELVYENPSNRQCADCRAPGPEWAAINIGITLCQMCAGVHREMPSAKVRSLRMDDKVWKPALIQLMKAIGNDNANRFWEATIKDMNRIDSQVDVETRTKFISYKYSEKMFCPHHLYTNVLSVMNNNLREAVQQSNLLQAMSLVFMGANVSRDFLEDNSTAVTSPDSTLVMEFLQQNSSERSMSLSKMPSPLTPKSAMWECLKHNRDVTHCGYLYKLTSATSKGPIPKRWYILQNGIFTYLANEKSGEVKESVDQRLMISVSVADDERVKHVFELMTVVNNTNNSEHQTYLLAAESSEDRQTWLVKLARSISPVTLGAAQQIRNMQRGGFVNVRLSLNHEWTRYWMHLSQKTLYIYIKEHDKWEEIDLRKATHIKTCKVPPKNNSEVSRDNMSIFIHLEFVNRCELNVQADALWITSMWLVAIKTAMLESVSHLSSQALNADNVPLFIEKCAEFIVKNGIEVEGVYRRSGHNGNIAELLKILHTNGARVACDKLDDFQIHDVTNALKRYLRKLDDPILMKAFYDRWIALTNETNDAEKVIGFRQLLAQLPIVNYCTLKHIIKHLLHIAEHEDVNKMSVSNLSMIFGAVLISNEVETPSAADLSAANHEIAVVRFLLEYYSELFEYHDKYVEKEKMLVRRQTVSEDVLLAAEASDDHIMLSFYINNKDGKMVTLKVLPCTKASEVVANIVKQEQLGQLHNWVLQEMICNDELERPIHYTETVVDVTMRWARWPEEFRRSNYLYLASANIYRSIDAVFDPFTPLYGDLKFASKKTFKKYFFEFNQGTLSYKKDSKGETKLRTWKVGDIIIYIGVQVKKNSPTRCGLTFITNSEPPISPYFGHSICFVNEKELYSWLAALMLAQHPEGLSVPSSVTFNI